MRGSLGQCKRGALVSSNASTEKIVRTITFSDRLAHTEPLFLNLDILPFYKFIQNKIGLFMYKRFYGLHPIMPCIVKIVMYTAMIPAKHNLHVAIGHSDLHAKSFYCTSIIIWNDIINNINIAVSFPKFKKLLTSY